MISIMSLSGTAENFALHYKVDNTSFSIFNVTNNLTSNSLITTDRNIILQIISICILVIMVLGSILYWKCAEWRQTAKSKQEDIQLKNAIELSKWERFWIEIMIEAQQQRNRNTPFTCKLSPILKQTYVTEHVNCIV